MCLKTQKLKVQNLWEIRAALYFITSVTSPCLGLVKSVWPVGSVKTKPRHVSRWTVNKDSPRSVTYVHVEYDRHADFTKRAACVKVTGLSIIYSVTYWRKCIHNLKELKLELLGTWGEWLCQTPLSPSSLIVFLGSFKPRLLSLILFQSWNTGDHGSFWCHSIWSLLCPMPSR